jgi:hypothetical protein
MNDNASHLPFFVLDVMRHDVIESIQSMLTLLNNDGCIGWRDCWPRDFRPDDILPALQSLAQQGHIEILREAESDNIVVPVELSDLDLDRDKDVLWFRLTQKGRQLWSTWVPPKQYDTEKGTSDAEKGTS